MRMPLVCAPSLALAELVWGAPKHLANYTGAKGQNIKISVGFGTPAAAPTGVGSKPLQKNRKKKRRQYTLRRVVAACQRYPSKLALVPSMAGRMAKCVKLRGANIGK